MTVNDQFHQKSLEPVAEDIKRIAFHANSFLRTHLLVLPEGQSPSWHEDLYAACRDAMFQYLGVITDHNGRSFFLVRPCDDAAIEHIDSFAISRQAGSAPDEGVGLNPDSIVNLRRLSTLAFGALHGVALTREWGAGQQRPDALLRFGSVWSYLMYGYLEGVPNVIADYKAARAAGIENPFDAVVDADNHQIIIGSPSEEFFPQFVRDLISREISGYTQGLAPEILLLTEPKYAMPTSIAVDIGSMLDQEKKRELAGRLTWYMPPYLPVAIR